MAEASLVVVMVSNGPGELSTWVRPLAEKLHKQLVLNPVAPFSKTSIRLALVPCPNATGHEVVAANGWKIFEKITPANKFLQLLISPKKYGFWPSKGLVIFLGGDQFWSVLLSARLGYKHMTYAEWVARWPQWNDHIAAMSTSVKDLLPKRFHSRCTVVGDLMADLSDLAKTEEPLPAGKWVALMPGSKRAKLCVGVPFLLEVADRLGKLIPSCNFILPVAPTTNIHEIQGFISSRNPIAANYTSNIISIKDAENNLDWKKIITSAGTEIHLYEKHPAHSALSQCDLALTTVGANTAELGALGVPMIVLVPTQHLVVMEAWDGFLGIVGRLPILKRFIGVLISIWKLKNSGFLAWPNISAKKMIVPEKVGQISPKDIAREASEWLSSPSRLKGQKEDLQSLRGKPGAVEAMAQEVLNLLKRFN